MFASYPDYADNARAIYEYMRTQEKYKEWIFVWLVSPKFSLQRLPRTRFIRRSKNYFNIGTVRYLYHVFTSKYLFCTHSHFVEASPSRQISVCLWHGTMLKRICAMNEREKNQPRKDQYRYFVSPSKWYIDIFCKSFLCQPKDVIVSGYPRNDFLFQDTGILKALGINRNVYSKIIVYMPTFRTPVGGGYSDSADSKQMCLDIENETSMKEMSDYLAERKMLLIIKWHPSDVRQTLSYTLSNIIFVCNRDLMSIDAQTYHLLHYADALVTDYSSVFCDYLILDRPIAFDVSDINSYSNKRGFVFENPLDFMPGVKLSNETEFKAFCDDVSKGRDTYKTERARLRHVYNDHSDGNNCERLVRYLNIEK